MPDLSPTPYDDVFRTLLVECSKLVIPLINEIFGEDYTGNEKIQFSPNEHFLRGPAGEEDKRITDGSFAIIGRETKRYHLECESTVDYSILVRIFEYDAQIALDQGSEVVQNRIIVTFPHTAVLFLRSTSGTPDTMEIIIRTPGGEVAYDVPVMKVKNYTIQEIFDKNLLFLIPFYIFTYESDFKRINSDPDRLKKLIAEYQYIRDRLEQLAADGVIDEYYKQAILDMSEHVINHIAQKYQSIQEGVGKIMGGQIIDFEAKRIRDAALQEGLEEGRILERIDMYRNEMNMDDASIIAAIQKKFNLTNEEARNYVLSPFTA